MLIPQVVGFALRRAAVRGPTATDLVLTVTDAARTRSGGQVRGAHGPGSAKLPLADRATIGNMSPEMGATCATFPVDAETPRHSEFLRPAGRARRAGGGLLPRAGPFHDENSEEAVYLDGLELDLSDVEPSLAGPSGPRTVALSSAANDFVAELHEYVGDDNVLTGYDERPPQSRSWPATRPRTTAAGSRPS